MKSMIQAVVLASLLGPMAALAQPVPELQPTKAEKASASAEWEEKEQDKASSEAQSDGGSSSAAQYEQDNEFASQMSEDFSEQNPDSVETKEAEAWQKTGEPK